MWPQPGRRFLVTDATVGARYADRLPPVEAEVRLEPGERHKTLASVDRVLRALAGAGMDHDDHVVALGGGVVGDVAGFCAAIYQRGVPVVHVPTTLVAQVDSAYGGKTGVDLPEGKNYAGAYHQPAAVLADPGALATLPPEELAAGWAEVIKTGLIAGGELWRRVRGRETPAPDRDLVLACARVKLRIVARDERDAGERQVLNLGHTVGHAIETVTAYERYRHGEAVGLGLLAALTLSGRPDLRDEVGDLLAARGLPTQLDPGIDRAAVAAAVQRDKKRRGGRVGFVLLDAPGQHADRLPRDRGRAGGRARRSWRRDEEPRRRPARGQPRRARAPPARALRRPLADAARAEDLAASRTSWGSRRASSSPTTRASSSRSCTAAPTTPTG